MSGSDAESDDCPETQKDDVGSTMPEDVVANGVTIPPQKRRRFAAPLSESNGVVIDLDWSMPFAVVLDSCARECLG